MDFQYFGGNCIRITTKKASVVIDDNLVSLGQKAITKSDDISLVTNNTTIVAAEGAQITITHPGEYEVSNISIQGIAAQGHMDEAGKINATIFKVVIDDVRVLVVGHVFPDLNEDQLETIGTVDVAFIPVGNHGYTLDAVNALKLIKKISPKIIVPTHYADKDLNYEVPQADLSEAIKELGMEVAETTPKLKLKQADLPEVQQLIVLERS